MSVTWYGTPNFSYGNNGRFYIFVHICEGWWDGSISTLQNPARQASAHYVISGSDVAQLVSEQAAQLRIAFCAGLMLCDAGVPCVEPNQLIVGHGRVPVLRFPYRAYLHAPVVSVAAGLRQRHVGEVGGEGPR